MKRKAQRYTLMGQPDSSGSESDSGPPPDPGPEQILADSSVFTRYMQTGLGTNLIGLPLRYLPPGSVYDLHRDMTAGQGREKVSFSTFNRHWKKFQGCLRFRSKGDFVECDYCSGLKRDIKNAKKQGYSELLDATNSLQQHYRQVAMSRELEEALRSMPPTGPKPILTICTDGMDQSHWAVPRLKAWRAAKKLGSPSCKRPKCKVQGVWCFYFGLHLFVADSVMPHDSSMVCECLARALEHVKRTAEKRNLPVPCEMTLIADNTVRESKNTTTMLFLAMLQSRGLFSSTALLNHVKGHTHNILDQMFGVLSRQFQWLDFLPDIWAVAEELRAVLRRPALKNFLSGAEPVVEVLESVRDWQGYFNQLQIHITGGLRLDLTANHAFLFLYRRWALQSSLCFVTCLLQCKPFRRLSVWVLANMFLGPRPGKEKICHSKILKSKPRALQQEGPWAWSLTRWTQ